MQEIKDEVSKKYWIAHNDSDVVHYGELDIGNVVSTGQSNLESFDTEQSWIDRLDNFGIDPNEEQ